MGLGGSFFGGVDIEPGHRDYPWHLAMGVCGIQGVLLAGGFLYLYFWQDVGLKEHFWLYFLREGLLAMAGAHGMGVIGLHAEKRWVAPSLLGLLGMEMAVGVVIFWMAGRAGDLNPVFVGLGILLALWYVFQAVVLVMAGRSMDLRARGPKKLSRKKT